LDAVNGSDSNSGLSEAAPWQTLVPLKDKTLAPGDTVHFKRGGIWNGPLVITNSGREGSPITFTDYGTGAKPVIKGDPALSYRSAIEIKASWVVVENLFAQYAHEAGIRIGTGWYASGADYNIVRNCEATQAGTGVTVSGEHNLITGNYAHDLTMIINTPGGDDDYGAVGFWLYGPNNEVAYNRCVNCSATSYDYGRDGGVFEIYHNGDNSYVHHNWGENSNGFFEAGGDSTQRTAQNVLFAYNVSYNNSSFACLHTGGTFSLIVKNFRVENNTVVQTGSGGQLFGCMSSFTSDTMSMRNNIFYTSATVFSNGGFTHENNLYYFLGGGKAGYSLGPGEKIADPLFVNAAGKDFKLRTGSPAINAGATLGYAADFDDVPVPQGSAPDIGAFEYILP